MTHAAVAQHVRALEDRFGQTLMERAGRGMVATEAGARLSEDLARGFAEIAAGVRSLDEALTLGPLSITTTRTFAETWLMPRLPRFWKAHPDIPLTISADDAVADLRRDGHHIAIRYGATGQWPGLDARLLTSGHSVLVGHPDIANRIDPDEPLMDELQKLPWLITTTFDDFIAWIAGQGLDLDRVQASYFGSNSLVLAGTRAGGRPVDAADHRGRRRYRRRAACRADGARRRRSALQSLRRDTVGSGPGPGPGIRALAAC